MRQSISLHSNRIFVERKVFGIEGKISFARIAPRRSVSIFDNSKNENKNCLHSDTTQQHRSDEGILCVEFPPATGWAGKKQHNIRAMYKSKALKTIRKSESNRTHWHETSKKKKIVSERNTQVTMERNWKIKYIWLSLRVSDFCCFHFVLRCFFFLVRLFLVQFDSASVPFIPSLVAFSPSFQFDSTWFSFCCHQPSFSHVFVLLIFLFWRHFFFLIFLSFTICAVVYLNVLPTRHSEMCAVLFIFSSGLASLFFFSLRVTHNVWFHLVSVINFHSVLIRNVESDLFSWEMSVFPRENSNGLRCKK